MDFPKPLGRFYVVLLSSFVAAAQQQNNLSGINCVINSVTGAMVNLQLNDTFADIADGSKVASPHPCKAGTDANCCYLVTQCL